MPSVRVHCAISKGRTKNNFKDLHEWIDRPQKELGVNHRTERHSFNLQDREFVAKNWGEKGVVEWLFHIAVDNLETAYKEARKTYRSNNVHNFFRFGWLPDSKFIRFDSKNLDEECLDEEFEDVYE